MADNQPRFLALLRGVNIGGKNRILKEDLRETFEGLGFTGVRTYIQSGNILFRSGETSVRELTEVIEKALLDRISYAVRVAVLSSAQYRSAVQAAPVGWGSDDGQRHNALFTLGDTTSEEVFEQLPNPKREIETVTTGPGVLFWSVSKEQLTRTTFLRLPAAPIYQLVTVRNHNTVFKLQELLEKI